MFFAVVNTNYINQKQLKYSRISFVYEVTQIHHEHFSDVCPRYLVLWHLTKNILQINTVYKFVTTDDISYKIKRV